MKDKDGSRKGLNVFEGGASDSNTHFFFRISESKAAIITFFICLAIFLTIIFVVYIFLNRNPSGAPLFDVTFADSDEEKNPGGEPALQEEECAETIYRVTAFVGLKLREGPSTESDTLRILPYKCEVISEGCADERGWMPVRVDGQRGYVFAAHIDPVS